jgi:hypothetical protein
MENEHKFWLGLSVLFVIFFIPTCIQVKGCTIKQMELRSKCISEGHTATECRYGIH